MSRRFAGYGSDLGLTSHHSRQWPAGDDAMLAKFRH